MSPTPTDRGVASMRRLVVLVSMVALMAAMMVSAVPAAFAKPQPPGFVVHCKNAAGDEILGTSPTPKNGDFGSINKFAAPSGDFRGYECQRDPERVVL